MLGLYGNDRIAQKKEKENKQQGDKLKIFGRKGISPLDFKSLWGLSQEPIK